MIDTSYTAGRKIATHEFPNSDNRTDEDLGRLNRLYTINAVITGNFPGEYDINKNLLISALDKPGIGILLHPFDGLRRAVAISYTLSETESRLNEANFSITFSESTTNISPFPFSNSVSELFSVAEAAYTALSDLVGRDYSVTQTSPANVDDAIIKTTLIVGRFRDTTTKFSSDPEFINTFSSLLETYEIEIVPNALDGDLLSNNTTDLFLSADDLSVTGLDAVAFYQQFYAYGDDDSAIEPTTVQRIERIRNRGLINALIQGLALIFSYQNASLIDFDREDQITELVNILDAQYFKLIENEFLGDEASNALTDLKTKTADFFRQAEIAAFRINSIKTNILPVTVLNYQYYGALDTIDDIVDLNNLQDVSFVEGEILVLTQ